MTSPLKHIVIVGQGAIGLLWYHHLSQASVNAKVSLLASDQQTLSASELSSAKYRFTAYQQNTAESYQLNYCQEKDLQQAELVILCLKSYHIANSINSIADKINEQCTVILAHNGMGTFEEIANLLPKNQTVIAMLTTHGCLRTKPLSITHTGLGQSDMGLLSGKISNADEEKLTYLLNQALPKVSFHPDIAQKQWLKLAINCVINPITAINNIDNGDINNLQFSSQIKALICEINLVSQAVGIDLPINDLHQLVQKVAQATAQNCSSMRCDILAGKPTEIDYINGYIHRLGKQHQIATPQNTMLWQQVKAISAATKK